MEVDKVADKVANIVADKKTKLMYARKQSVLGRSCLMRSVSDLRVYFYFISWKNMVVMMTLLIMLSGKVNDWVVLYLIVVLCAGN